MKLTRTIDIKLIASLNESVQKLHHELYPDTFKPFDFQSACNYFEKVINQENHHFMVCSEGTLPLGYIWFEEKERAETAFTRSTNYIYINQISVNADYRGKGVGKLLFSEVLRLAEERYIKRIGLDYWVRNEDAKLIYEKLGFKLEKEITYLTL